MILRIKSGEFLPCQHRKDAKLHHFELWTHEGLPMCGPGCPTKRYQNDFKEATSRARRWTDAATGNIDT